MVVYICLCVCVCVRARVCVHFVNMNLSGFLSSGGGGVVILSCTNLLPPSIVTDSNDGVGMGGTLYVSYQGTTPT